MIKDNAGNIIADLRNKSIVAKTMPIVFSSQGSNLADYTIYGNTGGVGDLNSTTGKYVIPITVKSKNLFDADNPDISNLYPALDNNTTISASYSKASIIFPVKPNTTYVLTKTIMQGNRMHRVAGYSSYPVAGAAYEFIDQQTDTPENSPTAVQKFTTTANTHYVICGLRLQQGDTYFDQELPTIMIEENTEFTEFQPYFSATVNIELNAPLTAGQKISLSDTNINIPTGNGTNILTVDTTTQPSKVAVRGSIEYVRSGIPVIYNINYYSQDGNTLIYSEPVIAGGNGLYNGTPTKESTAQYNYTFEGWSTSTNSTSATSGARTNITSNTVLYAAFSETTRTYSVYFYNDDTILETVNDVPYGGSATYSGTTPTKEGYAFDSWLPAPTNITGDTSCYAQFKQIPDYITDSWETISNRGIAGTAQNYYSVGDCKPIELNGTMGTLTFDHQTLYVYILGFNHNSTYEPNGITFGGFKTAATDGIDIALCDSHYNTNDTSGLKWFNMNHRQGSSQYSHNYGGWKGSDMRYDILGSTDTAPSGYGATATTSNVGYDASPTCATNPVANTLMSCLPSDLRAVMKPMTKYTDNVGNSSDVSGNVTSSKDYLPLLSEYEVFVSRRYANQYEQNKQARYAYYASGNSKIKYHHTDTSSSVRWWVRSPYYSSSTGFCHVDNGGGAAVTGSQMSRGVAPIFLVGTAPTTYTVTYYSQDGQTVLSTETVEEGHNCIYSTSPTKASDTDFDYNFVGWSTTTNSTTATEGATENIQQNTNLYAAFSKSLKGDTISDSWEEIIANCDNGTYASKYQVGDLKTIDVGTEGPVQMQIVAIDTDLLASDNTKKAPITWISKQLLNTYKPMHSTTSNYLSDWANCDMRTYLRGTILPMLPSVVQNGIKEVTKYTNKRTGSTTYTTVSATESIWLPSYRDISHNTSYCETSGVQYNSIFTNNASRVKSKVGNSAYYWWTRSASASSNSNYSYYFTYVSSDGGAYFGGNNCTYSYGVAIGFCT